MKHTDYVSHKEVAELLNLKSFGPKDSRKEGKFKNRYTLYQNIISVFPQFELHSILDLFNENEKEKVDKIEDSKPETITNSLNKFLSNGIKTTSDGKSTISSIPKNAADRAQEVAELYKELGLGNRAYETYLNLLHQDLIESDNNMFISTRARSEDYLERILEEAKGNGKAIPKSFIPPKSIPKEVNKLVDSLFKGDPKLSTIDVSKNQLLILRELYKKNPSISTYLKGAKNPEEVQQMINRIVEQGRLYGGYF